MSKPQRTVHRWRLGPRTRKAVLSVHIVAAGSWIGIDVVLGVLVFTALFTDDVRTAALAYQSLELFAIGPLFTAGLVCLASGVLLGLGTKYGVLRYWWVVAKLVVNVVFVVLVPLSLSPTVTAAAEYGRNLVEGHPDAAMVTDLVFPPIVSPTGLLIAVLLAVFKPWGRIGGSRRSARTRSASTDRPSG
ncbi:hypothetical protein HNR06_000805 [Nocardiopsis arvandica]|uniref:DUF2269 domain-containing protein n=1 Tax=Nocardiopsis sinuspersici TaxID=501010 RepID=A0A7Y9X8L7_9ACTN|nr:hypothetical protein [Nocardiopsis sinuspersici]NYH51216.1 hypothetical protein [Nocardiopsis sinuspersici]